MSLVIDGSRAQTIYGPMTDWRGSASCPPEHSPRTANPGGEAHDGTIGRSGCAPLPPRPNAIDASVRIAAHVMTDRSAGDGARAEHDTGPYDATRRVPDI